VQDYWVAARKRKVDERVAGKPENVGGIWSG